MQGNFTAVDLIGTNDSVAVSVIHQRDLQVENLLRALHFQSNTGKGIVPVSIVEVLHFEFVIISAVANTRTGQGRGKKITLVSFSYCVQPGVKDLRQILEFEFDFLRV